MSQSLADNVRDAVAEYRMAEAGDLVVVAVSGGPDSLCLLHVLRELRGELGFALHVAHLDHMLRGAESAAEAAFVEATAHAWELPATIGKIDVRAAAKTRRTNLHQAGRAARYSFLAQVARTQAARAIAVAHTADDQAETVLMHLLRGAGPAGLRGMRAVVPWDEWSRIENEELRIKKASSQSELANSQFSILNSQLIRPLLHVTRAEIEAYCATHGLHPRRDPSNFDMSATRNRIRHELLPRLIEYNPHIVAALGRTAAICGGEHDLVAQALAAEWSALAHERTGAIDFDGGAWRRLHPALQREALRQAYARLEGSATLELEHVEAARAAASGGVGTHVELPGGIALTVGYSGFALGEPPQPHGPQVAVEAIDLPVPGRAELSTGWAIEAIEQPDSQEDALAPRIIWQVDLDADMLDDPLIVRRRRAGDRFQPAGGPGRRRLQDMFVDTKVPRALRDAWPIVATSAAIIWVPGLRPAADFAKTKVTKKVLRLRLIQKT